MSLSQKLIAKATGSAGVPTVPNVYVEKSSVASNGKYAKVLFRIGTSSARAKEIVRNKAQLEQVFDAKLQGSARLVLSSVHPSDVEDHYCGYIKLNTEMMSFDVGQAKGLRSITANMFADAEDNIWNLQETSDGKILLRNSEDNLQELLSTRVPSPALSVAAAGYDLNGSVVAGQLVAYYDNANEDVRKGITVDNSAVFDFKFNKIVETASCDFIAATDVVDQSVVKAIDGIYGDRNITYKETSSVKRAELIRYLTALYGQNKDFLNAYLNKIDALLTV